MKEKIRELLGIGLDFNVVASAVGCDPSYISQLMSEEAFAQEVQTLKLTNLTESANRDGKYNSLEDRLIEKLEHLLPLLVRPMEILKAIQVINSAHRRAAPREMAATAQHQHVHLHLSHAVAQKFIVNHQNQIVEVDGRTIATMSAKEVVRKLETMDHKKLEQSAEHQKDVEAATAATERLAGLRRLVHLPVSDLV